MGGARGFAVALALSAAHCAPAHNYTAPHGPRYAGASGLVSDHEPSLRIVSFNIAYGRQIERAAECLAAPPLKGADVLLLQEMHAPGVAAIAGALRLSYVYYPSSVRRGEQDMGTAILSPWPILTTEKLILPHTTRIMGRGRTATVAHVRVDGVEMRVYSLHLGSPFGLSGRKRGEQAQAVIDDARRWPGPVIVGGDLNSHSVGRRFDAAGYRWLTRSIGDTVGPFSFDHVYVRGLTGEHEVGAARTCRGVSDHSPVWAVLAPPGAGGIKVP